MGYLAIFFSGLLLYATVDYLRFLAGDAAGFGVALVDGYLVVLVYILMFAAISLYVDTMERRPSSSLIWWAVRKFVFLYILLFWRHLYSPTAIFEDAILLSAALFLGVFWVWKSDTIAISLAAVIHKSSRWERESMIPGRTVEQRAVNGAIGIVVLSLLPLLFRHVSSIFGS